MEQRLPFGEIEDISVFGMAQLSTRLIRECISSNVVICYYTEDGHYFGSTSSYGGVHPARQKKQILLTEDASFCLAWSRAVIGAKLRNSMAFLESLGDFCEFDEGDTRGLTHSLESLHYAETVDMALGFEGNAAKSYFGCLAKAVRMEEFRFRGRSSRPPKDAFNSMLSFGYSMLYRNIIGAIERRGLHPFFAFMHKPSQGHAALASDLVEELRAPFVDAVVLECVNAGEFALDDFEMTDKGAVYMRRETMKRLTSAISQSMSRGRRCFMGYGDARSYGFQVMLDKKLDSVIDAIDAADASLYRPLLWEAR